MKLTWKQEQISKLQENYQKACENKEFVALVNSLNIKEQEAIKRTSKLEKTVQELSHCQKCPGLSHCQNTYFGHISMPKKENNQVYFTYVPCKYTKQRIEEQKEKDLLSHQNEFARLKDIHKDDKKRYQAIKWIVHFVEKYTFNTPLKGLYLYGNFGCGKTFLISALFHELEEQKKVKTALLYFPEILRTLKNDWEEYERTIRYYEEVDLLCIDDIGAEKVSEWSRDEVLGTILQTRMNRNKTTFFTSNLSLEELENHFKTSNSLEESLKARRIMERIKQLAEPLELVSENKRI